MIGVLLVKYYYYYYYYYGYYYCYYYYYLRTFRKNHRIRALQIIVALRNKFDLHHQGNGCENSQNDHQRENTLNYQILRLRVVPIFPKG